MCSSALSNRRDAKEKLRRKNKENSMRRIVAQIRKELTQIVRDWRTLALAMVLPLVLLLLLSTAISLTVNDLPMVVQDYDNSAASRDLIEAFRASNTFRIVAWPPDKQAEQALITNTARVVLIIPVEFGKEMARGVNAPVQLMVDASDANTAKLVSAYSGEVTSAYNSRTAAASHPALVQTAFRLWYNPGLSSKKFYGPGIFVLGLSMFPPLLAALAMAKEGEQKTILQVYVSSISAHEFLLGKILAFTAVALAESAVMLIILFTYFGLTLAGDPTPFFIATILYAFCVASFGTMIGATVPNQAAALQAVSLGGFLLVFLLSGLLFPIQNIPAGIRWISNIIWGRYYIEIVRDALLQGGGWPAVWYKVLIIGVIGFIFYGLGWRTMRRMQLKA
jgi:drug efflux transport system permease protein